jgi:uncharacterized protein involved in exopolysaccharide biosynthesis
MKSPSLIDSSEFESRTVTWEDIGSLVSRRWKTVVLVLAATCLGTYTALQLMTERYETAASIMMKIGRENAEIPATVQKSRLVTGGVNEQEVNSEIQMLRSRPLAEAVVQEVGNGAFRPTLQRPTSLLKLGKFYIKLAVRWAKKQRDELLIAANLTRRLTENEAAVTAVEDSLQVQSEKNSDVISLHLQLSDPELGKRVLDTLLRLYLVQHSKVYENSDASGFFGSQLADKGQELERLQQVREQVRNQYGLNSVAEQRSLLLKELSDLKTQMELNRSEQAMLRNQERLMKERLKEVPAELQSSEVQTQNPSIQSIRDRLTSLQLEHAKLASRYLRGSEPLKKNEEEIAELTGLLAHQQPTLLGNVTSEANPVRLGFLQAIEQDEIKIQGLEAKNSALGKPFAEIESRLRTINSGEDELHTLERQIEIAEKSYTAYAQDLEDSRVSQQLDSRRIANISVLSAPSSSYEPVYPRKLLIMGIAVPFGLLFGIAIALGTEYMDDTIRTSRDLSDLNGLPCLGSFPLYGDAKEPKMALVGD